MHSDDRRTSGGHYGAPLPMEQVMVNIEHFGNTSAATIPLAIWENEHLLHKGDHMILTAFGAGFVHGASYLKWAYDPE